MSDIAGAFDSDAGLLVRGLKDTVADQLRNRIASAALKPGQSLPESELAAALKVSRGPIREALAILAHEGLVVTRRGHSAQVVDLSVEDAREIYSLRTALETLAISHAAEHATSTHVAMMRDLLREFEGLTHESTPKRSAELDLQFHDIIYQASQHGRLQKMWAQIRPQAFMFLLTRNYLKRDFFELAAREHRELLDSIVAGDPDGGAVLIKAHLRGAYERLISNLAPAAETVPEPHSTT